MQPLMADWKTGLCLPQVLERAESGLIKDYQRLNKPRHSTGLNR